MKNFFEKPTQVAFIETNENEPRYIAGIAYGCFITCLECGSVIEIDDLIADAAEAYPDRNPIVELPWISLNEACIGDMMFDEDGVVED